MMKNALRHCYEDDIIAWANEQARFIRAGRFDLIDIANIAEEIEDVGKSEKREFSSRMAILLGHLLKWQYQPDKRSNSWEATIKVQRIELDSCLLETPSLKVDLDNPHWWHRTWAAAVGLAVTETGLAFDVFPPACPWTIAEILSPNWKPAQVASQNPTLGGYAH